MKILEDLAAVVVSCTLMYAVVMANKRSIKETAKSQKKAKGEDLTTRLSDEFLATLLLEFIPDATSFAQLSAVNRRFRLLLNSETIIQKMCEKYISLINNDGIHADNINAEGWTWREFGFYQVVSEAGLFKENRLGFDFASTEIDENEGEASGIAGSRRRVENIAKILQQFETATLTVDAHCGIAAPTGIAPGFSRARGVALQEQLVRLAGDDLLQRITVNPWGRRVTERAAVSSHSYGAVAREGRGWVEVYLSLGDVAFPNRPEFYEGIELNAGDLEEDIRMIRAIFRF